MSERTSAKPTGEKDDGPSKFIKRMRTVLKSGSRSNRGSVSSIGEVVGEPSKSKTQGTTSSSTPKPATPARAQKKESTTMESVPVHQWSIQQQEKARALFAKYGLTLEPGEWMSQPAGDRNIQRIEKPIRMRVRRNCHRCLTTFGAEKVCPGCQHLRCKKCFRYPPAKPKEGDEKEKGKARVGGAPTAKEAAKPKRIILTIPSRTGGQDLVHKPIRQRIRRTCHRCQTLFIGDATECQGCRHIRCKKCPRDPPKLHKYPDGYPGDAEPPFEPQERIWRKPRRRIRWTCHSCNKLFSTGDKTCSNCQHERCKDCIRDPPKKIKPEPDPDLLRRVEEKLARLNVS